MAYLRVSFCLHSCLSARPQVRGHSSDRAAEASSPEVEMTEARRHSTASRTPFLPSFFVFSTVWQLFPIAQAVVVRSGEPPLERAFAQRHRFRQYLPLYPPALTKELFGVVRVCLYIPEIEGGCRLPFCTFGRSGLAPFICLTGRAIRVKCSQRIPLP